MSEEQYKKTFAYRHNELIIAFWDLLYGIFSGWNRPCRFALRMRTESIKKAERDYKDYVMDELPTRLEGSD